MKKYKVSNEDISNLCSELGYLLHAGIGNADALQMLSEDESRTTFREILSSMATLADEGLELSEIFLKTDVFPDYVGKMIKVGENTGRIEEALEALTLSCGRKAEMEKRMKSSLLYPSILLLIMLVVIAVLLIYVMPVFNSVYSQLGGSLTGIAGGLLSFGRVLSKFVPALITVFCFAVLFLALFSSVPVFRDEIIENWQKKRGDKGVAGKLSAASFAQALALSMSSGMAIDEAVESSAELAADTPLVRERLSKCVEGLRNGENTALVLKESGLIPPSQCRILEAGIRGGSGEKAMEQIALRLTEESEQAMEEALGRIEPTMVVIASLLVGIILLSVMLPLINIMSAIG